MKHNRVIHKLLLVAYAVPCGSIVIVMIGMRNMKMWHMNVCKHRLEFMNALLSSYAICVLRRSMCVIYVCI